MAMPEAITTGPASFIERRGYDSDAAPVSRERRQFASSHDELSVEGRELAQCVDAYKVMHRRRFITHDELLHVIKSLGYHR